MSHYRIKTAVNTSTPQDTLVESIQDMYEHALAGQFTVEAVPMMTDWYWVTFDQELFDVEAEIIERMRKSNFNLGPKEVVLAMFKDDIATYKEAPGTVHPTANWLLAALDRAHEITWPAPEAGD